MGSDCINCTIASGRVDARLASCVIWLIGESKLLLEGDTIVRAVLVTSRSWLPLMMIDVGREAG